MTRSFRRYAIHVVFALTLVSLTALLGHWTLLLWRNETGLIRASWRALKLAARTAAAELGAREEEPKKGPLAGYRHLEVLRASELAGADPELKGWPAEPKWSEWAVRPSPSRLDELRRRRSLRIIMVAGEGVLAGLLTVVCILMLYRLFRLEQKQRAEAEFFLGSITHELKSPVTGLKALLQTLSRHDVPDEERRQYLKMGLLEADRLQHLVENCLLAARMKQRELEVAVKTVPLGPYLHEFVERRQTIRAGKEPAVPVDGDRLDQLAVSADPDRLGVILENLLDNAFKYGGADARVAIRVRAKNDRWVKVRVEDSGRGFPAHMTDALFEGVRLGPDGDRRSEGVGLGLGISRHLARLMGGELVAESRGPGKGSAFELTMARAQHGDTPQTSGTPDGGRT